MDSTQVSVSSIIANSPGILIALQIATLGWRINREIPLGDAGRRTWFPVADCFNVISLISVVLFCVLLPLNKIYDLRLSNIALSVGFILMGMYPINLIGHYRFASRHGRSIYENDLKDIYGEVYKDYPYITDHERVTLSLTGVLLLVYLAYAFS
jgi:hypothetical protein